MKVIPAREYGAEALRVVEGARTSLDLFMYSFAPRASRPEAAPFRLVEALRRAKERGVRVRVVLDRGADPDGMGADPEARNAAARDLLAGVGVDVFMDDPRTVTHAKVLIADRETVLLGSSNWTATAFDRNVEANVLIRSTAAAATLLKELTASLPEAQPAAAPVLVPRDFLGPALLGRLVNHKDERGFDIILHILRSARPGDALTLDRDALAPLLGMDGLSRENARKMLQRSLVRLRDEYGLIRMDDPGYNREPVVTFLLPAPSSASVHVPREFWDWGWDRKLSLGGKVFYLLSLHHASLSPSRPRWSLSRDALAARHGISPNFISDGLVELRRAGLVEVQYGELDRDGGARDVSVYTPLPLYDPRVIERRFVDLGKTYGPDKLARARAYAALVYDDSDAAGVEMLIRLEEEFGPERLRWAAGKLEAKDPGNPKRSLGYFVGIIRNPD